MLTQPRPHTLCFSLVAAVGLSLGSGAAFAQSTIRNPGARSAYELELEPHFLFGPFDPPGRAHGDGLGAGLRATVELAQNGFLAKVNDSVGLGFGVDFVRYRGIDARGECTQSVPGPNATWICVEVDGSGWGRDRVYLPVVMQWNFWLTESWSVFGEPGLFAYFGDGFGLQPFTLFAGGRYHFADSVALTLRLGYPTLSVGLSLLL